ncbi:MAG: flippase [Promethearchaeota archaeon]
MKNTGVLFLGTIVSKLCTLAFFAIAARYIGPEGFGKYIFALSFTGMFIILGDLGLNTLAIREVAKDRTLIKKYLGNITILKTILSAIIVGIIFLVITLLNYPSDTTKVVYIIGISVFFTSLSQALRWTFQAFQNMEYEALVNIVQGALLLGFAFLVLYLDQGLIGLAFSYLSTSILVFCFSFLITVKKFAKPKFEVSLSFWKFSIKTAIPIGLTAIFAAIYLNIDTVMLSLMKSDVSVGWYNAGHKLVEAIKVMPSMFVLAIFPVMANFYKTSIESLKTVFRKSIQYIFILALPIAIGTTILSYKIIPIIWGQEFIPAIPALQILIWSGALVFLSGVAGNVLIAIDKQKINAYICFWCLVINIILNLILIPKFSYIGAAIAILIAEFMITLLAFFFIFQKLKVSPFPPKIIKIIIASLLMGLFLWFIKDINIILSILVSTIFYFIVLSAVKGISLNDLKLIVRSIKTN